MQPKERDLKRHAETRHRADSREKTDRGEIDNKGKDLGDYHKFIGLVNLSRTPVVPVEKEKSAEDFSAFEPSQKVGRIKQGDGPETSKTKSKPQKIFQCI
jgi:hypothetical protein